MLMRTSFSSSSWVSAAVNATGGEMGVAMGDAMGDVMGIFVGLRIFVGLSKSWESCNLKTNADFNPDVFRPFSLNFFLRSTTFSKFKSMYFNVCNTQFKNLENIQEIIYFRASEDFRGEGSSVSWLNKYKIINLAKVYVQQNQFQSKININTR
uniref:Uncharacterized protein n=1 Tax=Cacopsylla melanoneura TaxID=428564 RepID=A0A8D8Z2Z9_9HEMI